jgi:hypothetical protein
VPVPVQKKKKAARGRVVLMLLLSVLLSGLAVKLLAHHFASAPERPATPNGELFLHCHFYFPLLLCSLDNSI